MSTSISPEILAVLDDSSIIGNTLFLPTGQLDRKLYVGVNKCLEALGGAWNKKAKGHIFPNPPDQQLENVILTGKYVDQKSEYQYFPTPKDVVLRMLAMADIRSTDTVLEPSAGQGAIADEIRTLYPNIKIYTVELFPDNVKVLVGKGFAPIQGDFLTLPEAQIKVDRIVMNPPFTRQQDVDHVLHAYSLLAPAGILVSVVSESPFFRTTAKANALRELVESHGESIKPPENSFKSSGTGVNTRIVKLVKA